MEKTWRSRSEEGVDAERPARSGEDEEKSLLGRVAAGDFLSHTHTHTQEGVKKLSWVCVCLSWLRSISVCLCELWLLALRTKGAPRHVTSHGFEMNGD